MAIPAKNAFLEAPTRLIHMHLKIISAQTGGSYIVSKMRNLQFTDSAFSLSFIGLLFFKCKYLIFAEKMVSPIDD